MEISTLSAHQMAHGGVVAHTSSWTPVAYELEESSPPLDSHIGGLPELPDGRREQGDKVVCTLTGPTAGKAAGYRGGVINTGIEDILVLPAVPVVTLLPGPALRDGFSHVLGLRIFVPEALRRLFRQLLRQRQPLVDLSILDSSIFLVSDDSTSTRFRMLRHQHIYRMSRHPHLQSRRFIHTGELVEKVAKLQTVFHCSARHSNKF